MLKVVIMTLQCALFLNNQSDIELQKKQSFIITMACNDQDVLFRPVDPPKDDDRIGDAAAKESRDAKFLV